MPTAQLSSLDPLTIVLESPAPLAAGSCFLDPYFLFLGLFPQSGGACPLMLPVEEYVGGIISETNVFVLPLHLIGNLPEFGILIWKGFSFRILKALPPGFWVPVWVLKNRKPFLLLILHMEAAFSLEARGYSVLRLCSLRGL